MRIVIQRVSEANVTVDGQVIGQIGVGFVVLLGIETADQIDDADWLVQKTCSMRIFSDHEGKMNKDLIEAKGDVLLVSQFTLHASTKKGNRPSFIRAARPDQAIPLYEHFALSLEKTIGRKVHKGKFGAMMMVHLINDGPVTIIMDSRNRE